MTDQVSHCDLLGHTSKFGDLTVKHLTAPHQLLHKSIAVMKLLAVHRQSRGLGTLLVNIHAIGVQIDLQNPKCLTILNVKSRALHS